MVAQAVPTEHIEQMHLVAWLTLKGLKFTSIPNSTYTKSWKQKKKNQEEGLHGGLPDLLIITPKGLLFIEMKRTKRGIVSPAQQDWIDALNECKNVQAEACYGFDQAKACVERFL
jgi:hypothetical protein